jgi:hypothetical protein
MRLWFYLLVSSGFWLLIGCLHRWSIGQLSSWFLSTIFGGSSRGRILPGFPSQLHLPGKLSIRVPSNVSLSCPTIWYSHCACGLCPTGRQIFGEDEKIYGYRDLIIHVSFKAPPLIVHVSQYCLSASWLAEICLRISCAISLREEFGQTRLCLSSRWHWRHSGQLHSTRYDGHVAQWTIAHTFVPVRNILDYSTDEEAFLSRVEQDAVTFKPSGQMIYSYTRPSPAVVRKGKETPDSESGDAIVFEVYRVCDGPLYSDYHHVDWQVCNRQHGIPPGSKIITGECNYLFSCTLRGDHISKKKKSLGNLSFCKCDMFQTYLAYTDWCISS